MLIWNYERDYPWIVRHEVLLPINRIYKKSRYLENLWEPLLCEKGISRLYKQHKRIHFSVRDGRANGVGVQLQVCNLKLFKLDTCNWIPMWSNQKCAEPIKIKNFEMYTIIIIIVVVVVIIIIIIIIIINYYYYYYYYNYYYCTDLAVFLADTLSVLLPFCSGHWMRQPWRNKHSESWRMCETLIELVVKVKTNTQTSPWVKTN